MKQYTKAIQDARRVIAIRPKWAKGHARLAAAHFALQDYSEVSLLKQEHQRSTYFRQDNGHIMSSVLLAC